MERDNMEPSALIDLGAASTQTKGSLGEIVEVMGLWHKAGISDE